MKWETGKNKLMWHDRGEGAADLSGGNAILLERERRDVADGIHIGVAGAQVAIHLRNSVPFTHNSDDGLPTKHSFSAEAQREIHS